MLRLFEVLTTHSTERFCQVLTTHFTVCLLSPNV